MQYILLGILVACVVVAVVLYRANKQQQRANQTLEQQRGETAIQRDKAEKALTELTITQAQLIQKEKLASLGELTAGIAHEIQNPLNFVNNFADVSVELVDELTDELGRGDSDGAKAVADDLRLNLQRIAHNGQRASNIVKGMLEHTRTESSDRQPANLNALVTEYLRRAYESYRVKYPAFSCHIETDLAPSLPLANVAAQDISRVLLNLFNNAFYAVQERASTTDTPAYVPAVSVQTGQTNEQITIRVADTGTGMAEGVRAKIFQPFFTTKPTGQGTGLGLSLSYDIITKGHNGTLAVESQPGAGSTFLISLPL
jgi:two-component system, NtrC family, sensor kinase